MGLDVSHDCWHGSYIAFMQWRNKVSEVAGYGEIQKRWGFASPWASDKELEELLPWPDIKTDPLIAFLTHSDCEGKIDHQDCGAIADRLEELLPALDKAGKGGEGHVGYHGGYGGCARKWIKGLRLAKKERRIVRFH